MHYLIERVRAVLRARKLDRDFEDEIESHLGMLVEEYSHRGMSQEEALRAARLELGKTTQLREAHRSVRGLPFLETLFQDTQYAVRGLAKHPGFTATAVLALALGIGVNTAVFTAYSSMILRPLQAVDPDQVLQISGRNELFSYPAYTYYRQGSTAFSVLTAATQGHIFSLGGIGGPTSSPAGSHLAEQAGLRLPWTISSHSEQAGALGVSGNYFQVLGVNAVIGRTLLPTDDVPGARPVALISENFWERRFGRDPSVLGRKLTLDGFEVVIVGVTPHNFTGTFPFISDFWLPLVIRLGMDSKADPLHDHGALWCRLYGRLAQHATRPQADAEINALAARYQVTFFGPDGLPISARRLRLTEARPLGANDSDGREILVGALLLSAIGLVLLIACANVASLLLARSAARQREIAVRLAIGAARSRLIRQLLTENAVMSLMAGAAGVLFSWWSLKALIVELRAFLPTILVLPLRASPDIRVLAYTLFLAVGATLAFGLAPAMESSKPDLTSALKDEGAAFGGRLRKSVLRDVMVGTQVAVCALLLIAAGLLIRTSQHALQVDLGFDYTNIVALHVNVLGADAERLGSVRTHLANDLKQLPGIQSVAGASRVPLTGGGKVVFVSTDGSSIERNSRLALYARVTPNYFETMRIPILRGRNFTDQEARDGLNFDNSPVVISEATARLFWPGQDPLGKRFSFAGSPVRFGSDEYPHSTSSVVIGVAHDVRSADIYQPDRTSIYLPATEAAGALIVRSWAKEPDVLTAIEREVKSSPADIEVTVDDSQTAFTNQPGFVVSRVGAIVAAIVGMLGILMASIGIHGTVGFAVAQRIPEIGIRMALGAKRRDVLGLVLSQTMRPVTIGLAIGFVLTAIVARLMSLFLVDLSPLDPIAFLGASGLLCAVALLACFLPARHAAKVDPMTALRYE